MHTFILEVEIHSILHQQLLDYVESSVSCRNMENAVKVGRR